MTPKNKLTRYTTNDLIAHIAAENHCTLAQAHDSLFRVLEGIVSFFLDHKNTTGVELMLRNFGTFTCKPTPARVLYMKKQGKRLNLPERNRVSFRPSDGFDQALKPLDK